jgi:predicted Zn-dependent protease
MCDTEVKWMTLIPGVKGSRPGTIALWRDILSRRPSLGWSALEKALITTIQRVNLREHKNVHVVYIGDGVITTGNADPVAFAQRIQRFHQEKKGTFHAVAPSSKFEPSVLKAIASLGGGSLRKIEGSATPSVVANRLLTEISAPGLRDMQIEFKGLRTARVYPENLPNLPRGQQQIVIGRYLPTAGDREQAGEIVVSGMRDGKKVIFRSPVSLVAAESGNSFIPRLWARMHVESLLEEGRTAEVRDDIIALSEEYHIMTPYTSFLVLESDADRERFKVKRRFQMRDGEKFFAEGRDNASYELLQRQLKVAGTWRLNLRRNYLRELRRLGRFPIYNPAVSSFLEIHSPNVHFGYGGKSEGYFVSSGKRRDMDGFSNYSRGRANPLPVNEEFELEDSAERLLPPGDPAPEGALGGEDDPSSLEGDRSFDEERLPLLGGSLDESKSMSLGTAAPGWRQSGSRDRIAQGNFGYLMGAGKEGKDMDGRFSGIADELFLGGGTNGSGQTRSAAYYDDGGRGWYRASYIEDLQSLFPALVGLPGPQPDRTQLKWPKDAVELADSLVRTGKLAALEGAGVEVRVNTTMRDLRFDRVAGMSKSRHLLGGTGWLNRTSGDRSVAPMEWCSAHERGVLNAQFQLGRLRKAVEGEEQRFRPILEDSSFTSLVDQFQGYVAVVEDKGENRAQLSITIEQHGQKTEVRLLIDTARKVLLKRESFLDGELRSRAEFSAFVEVGGSWWARRVKQSNAKGELTSDSKLVIKALDADGFKAAFKRELTGREKAIFLHGQLPTVEEAKQFALEKRATFESELVLLQHFAASQQWEKVDPYFVRLQEIAAGKPGLGWLEMRYLSMKRRNEEVKTAIMAAARKLAGKKREGDYGLAAHLRTSGNRVMAPNEQHDLLEILRPVYERQPAHTWILKEWETAQMWSFQNIGRQSVAVSAASAIATTYDWDANSQTNYANMLSGSGDGPAALAWINGIMEWEVWNDSESAQFRQQYVQQLEKLARFKDIRAYLAKWLDDEPALAFRWVYQRYAGTLIRLGQVDDAHALVEEWIDGAVDGDGNGLDSAAQARLNGGLDALFGYGHYYRELVDARFHERLAKVVRKFATSKTHANFAVRVMSDSRFHRTDEIRELRAGFAAQLVEQSGVLPLADVRRLVGWISANQPAVEKATWQKIVDPLIERWAAEKEISKRDQWAPVIVNILGNRIGGEVLTEFLQRQHRESPKEQRRRYAYVLFNHLTTSTAWSDDREQEAFDLLYLIGPHSLQVREVEKGGSDLLFRAAALMQLNDWMLKSGFTILYAKVEKKEELSRTEIAAASREKRKEIRELLVKRLQKELDQRKEIDVGFRPWLLAERHYLDVYLGHDSTGIAVDCWEYLGGFDQLGKLDERTLNERNLLGRFLDTLEYLAAIPKAEAQLVKRVLALHDRGLVEAPEDDAWKRRKYRLMVALDRPEQLKAMLRGWIVPGEADTQWRVSLGYLLAELNEIAKAIAEFEAVEKADELRSREYRILADWYHVKDERKKRERALLGVYKTLPESQVSQRIYRHTSQIRQSFESGVPEDFDPEVVTMFTTLFHKSERPSNYVGQLSSLYRYTKDFRLLECLPEGIIGHTALQVYPFLQQMTSVHQYIEDEATADSIFAHLLVVRGRIETNIDQRGLDLLEMLVRRKASEVLNQPGQHVPQALVAMKRAFKLAWEDGERKEMARFLHALGRITQEPLAKEQIREMEVLHRDEKTGEDRRIIGHLRGKLLWKYGRKDEALIVLEGVLREAEARGVNGEVLPQTAQGALHTYLGFLVEANRYARGEKELLRHLGREVVSSLRSYLVDRKYKLYQETLHGKGTVSIGNGVELYRNTERLIVADLPAVDHNLRYLILHTLVNVYHTAYRMKLGDAPGDAKRFAYGNFDKQVPFETNKYQSLVSTIGSMLRHLVNPVEGLRFLITRYEKEPPTFLAMRQGGWRSYGGSMTEYRYQAGGKIGDLAPRLLKIAARELRRSLTERHSQRNSLCWHRGNSRFWTAKLNDFVAVAEDVLEKDATSLQTIVHVARYFETLKMRGRSIEILVDGYERKLLDETAWALLVQYLEQEHRWKNVVNYLVPLIEFRPDALPYRVRLMNAYFHSGNKEMLVATLDAAEKRWREKKWWNEGTLSTLGTGCAASELWQRCVIYFEELIPMHRRARSNRIAGDGTLSTYYQTLARAHQQLGNTPGAVDAAAGAIICWDADHGNRASALRVLVQVLQGSKDLDGYVVYLDKEVAESGMENPIVRKAIGVAYLAGKKFDRAITQLKLAVATQPNDAETHSSLVEAYTRKKDEVGAIAQLLESAKLSTRNIKLFEELAQRYEELGQKGEAERARTSIVEALPNESEGHALLAEIRQKQDRWVDAAIHWEQVAEIRALEPTGLQKLADVQIRLERYDDARASLEKLLAKNWPSRFANVHRDARKKLVGLEKKAS